MKVSGQLQPQYGQQVDVKADFTDEFYREFLVFEQMLSAKLEGIGFNQAFDVNFLSDYENMVAYCEELKKNNKVYSEAKMKQN